MSPYQTIFWDNDGTLVNTEPAYFEATKKVLATVGVELTYEWFCNEHLKKGTPTFELAQNCTPEEIQFLRVQRNDEYEKLLRTHVEILPGVVETLSALYGKIPMSIVTTSRREHFETIMEATKLGRFFDFSICQEDVAHVKPDPEPYLKAWERSGFPKEACLAVEDSERGLIAAKAAGIACFVVPNELSQKNDFSKADQVLKNLEEILQFL